MSAFFSEIVFLECVFFKRAFKKYDDASLEDNDVDDDASLEALQCPRNLGELIYLPALGKLPISQNIN